MELLVGENVNQKKNWLATPNCPPKRLFQFISSPTVYKNTPFAISQKDLLLSIFLHLCQSHVWEMMPCYYLICFPLITSEAVNLFSSAICLSSTNYLLMSWFAFIWGYLSLFCWFIRLLYIVHVSISYICNRYFFTTYILKCLVYGLFCHLKVWCIQMYLLSLP